MSNNNRHEIFEKSVPMLVVGIIFAISLGGLVEITPLFFQKQTTEPVEGLKPYTALQMEGRDIFIREGCTVCHSQMIRPFRAETERYGHYSVAGESVGAPLPVGLQAYRSGSGPGRRSLFRRLASCPPDQPARCGTRVQHARLPLARHQRADR